MMITIKRNIGLVLFTVYVVLSLFGPGISSAGADENATTEDEFAAVLSAVVGDEAHRDEFIVTYSIVNGNQLAAEDVFFRYDSAQLEFISAESANAHTFIALTNEGEDAVRVLAFQSGVDQLINGDGDVLKVIFKMRDGWAGSSLITANSKLSDDKGAELVIQTESFKISSIRELKLDVKFKDNSFYKLDYQNEDGKLEAHWIKKSKTRVEENLKGQDAIDAASRLLGQCMLLPSVSEEAVVSELLSVLGADEEKLKKLELEITFADGQKLHHKQVGKVKD